jgi:hypothetical protein
LSLEQSWAGAMDDGVLSVVESDLRLLLEAAKKDSGGLLQLLSHGELQSVRDAAERALAKVRSAVSGFEGTLAAQVGCRKQVGAR